MTQKKQAKIRTYNIKQAQQHFERLIREAYAGDDVFLMRRTTTVAKLVPVRRAAKRNQPRSGGRT